MVPTAQTDRQTDTSRGQTHIQVRIACIMIWTPQLRQTDRQTQGEARLTCRYSMHHDMDATAQTDRQTDTRRGQTHIQV